MSIDTSEKHAHQVSPSDAPSEAQMKTLVEVISRSQHNYRDLIDNLDQAVFTLSFDGEVPVANRYLSQLLGVSFPDSIGRPLAEFVGCPGTSGHPKLDSRFCQQGRLVGRRSDPPQTAFRISLFQCWLQAVPEEGRGVSVVGGAGRYSAARQGIGFADLL